MELLAAHIDDARLIRAFRAFHEVVVAEKQRAAAARGGGKDAAVTLAGGISMALARSLDGAFEADGPLPSAQTREARYIMAALADEAFLHQLAWDGRDAWKDSLLEARLFGSFVAGEKFFTGLEALLARRDPADAELAAVYLFALSLGFEGRHRGTDASQHLAALRARLHDVIARHPVKDAPSKAFAQAYAHTLAAGDAKRLPNGRRWALALALFLALFVGVSHGLWDQATADIRATINKALP